MYLMISLYNLNKFKYIKEDIELSETKRPTIRELAKLAGVSPATVSLVINKKAGVNAETRKRVLDIAEQTDYLPGTSLRRTAGRTGNIAVILPQSYSKISEMFQIELNESIIDACGRQACNAVFTSVREESGRPCLPDILEERDVDGIILIGDTDDYTYELLKNTDLPIVMLDCNNYREDRPSVNVDYQQAAYAAANFLIGLGHQDIAYIGNEQVHQFNMRVFSGFQNAVQEAKLQLISVNRIQMNVYDELSFDAAMQTLFESGQVFPTALFCATDLHAIYALHYLANHGVKVPQDVSVIGMDDLLLSKYVFPPLTTIRVNRIEMGKLGVDMLIKKISDHKMNCVILPSNELIIRGSTAPPH